MRQLNAAAERYNEALTNEDAKERYREANRAAIEAMVDSAVIDTLGTDARACVKKDIIENYTDETVDEIIRGNSDTVSEEKATDAFKRWASSNIISYETLKEGLKTGSGTGAKILGSQMDSLLSENQRVLNQFQQEEKTKDDK